MVDSLVEVYDTSFPGISIDFNDLGFTISGFNLALKLHDIRVSVPDLASINLDTALLRFSFFSLFSSSYLSSVSLSGVHFMTNTEHNDDISLVSTLWNALNSIKDMVDFDVEADEFFWGSSTDTKFLSKIQFFKRGADKVLDTFSRDGSHLNIVMHNELQDLRIRLSHMAIHVDDDVGSFMLDSSFTVKPVLTDKGFLFYISDISWYGLNGGKAKVILDKDRLEIVNLAFDRFDLVGQGVYNHKLGKANIGIKFSDVPLLECLSLWPGGLSETVKDWIRKNVVKGFLDDLQVDFEYKNSGIKVSVISAFRDLGVGPSSEGKQSLLELSGRAIFDNEGFRVQFEGGKYKNIELDRGVITFDYDQHHVLHTHFNGQARADLEDVYTLFNKNNSLPIENLKASIIGDFSLTFVDGKQDDLQLNAKMRNVHVVPIGFYSDELRLVYNDDKPQIYGYGRIGDKKLFIRLVEISEKGVHFRCNSKFDISKDIAKLGFDMIGSAASEFDFTYSESKGMRIVGDIKLQDVQFGFDYFEWSSNPQQVTNLNFVVAKGTNSNSFEIESFNLASKGLLVAGSGVLTNEMIDLVCPQVQIGDNEFSFTYKKVLHTKDTVNEFLQFKGKRVHLNLGIKGQQLKRMIVNGEIKELVAKNGVLIRDLIFKADSQTGESFVSGKFNNDKDFVLVYDHKGLDVASQDAGLLLSGLDITGSMNNGKLLFHINPLVSDDNIAYGSLFIDNFSLINAPPLAQILSVASLQDIATMLSGEGIVFNSLRAPFAYNGDEIIFQESWLEGNSLGISFKGDFDIASQQYDFKGEIVPFYTINKIVSDIPIFGTMLSGGAGKGVFSVDYTIRSQTGIKDFNVNILSMFAPKIFKLFAYVDN